MGSLRGRARDGGRFDALNSEREAQGQPSFAVRVGIHSGDALIGNIGSQRRMGYTAMGDSVNLTCRLEELTRQYQVRILVSETVRNAVGDEFRTRFVDEVTVRGRAAPIRVYELQGQG